MTKKEKNKIKRTKQRIIEDFTKTEQESPRIHPWDELFFV